MKKLSWSYAVILILVISTELVILKGCKCIDDDDTTTEKTELLTSTWWRLVSIGGLSIPYEAFVIFRSEGYSEGAGFGANWKLKDGGNTLLLTSIDGWSYSYDILVLTATDFQFQMQFSTTNEINVFKALSDCRLLVTGASDLSKTGVKLHCTARANKSPLDLSIEYGTSLAYGQTVNTIPNLIEVLTYNDVIDASVSELIPETVYHYRLKANIGSDEFHGEDLTFRTFNNETVLDKNGNEYNTVTIGNQVWMAQNLMATNFNDGSRIPLVTNGTEWGALTSPGYCWFNNDSSTYKKSNAALYNWYAVSTGKLCPTGWHVASDQEWTTLEQFLGTEPGNKLYEYGSNTTGFSAKYGGFRWEDDGNYGPFECCYYWSSTEESNLISIRRDVDATIINKWSWDKNAGFSVRCVKDN